MQTKLEPSSMKKPNSSFAIILAMLTFTVITILTTSSRGQNPPSSAQQKDEYPHLKAPPGVPEEKVKQFKEELTKLPLADYDGAEPVDRQERAIRRARNKVHDHKIGKEGTGLRLAELAVMNNDWELGLKSTIPAVQSSAVIIGEVTENRAFVADDKTRVYSEFVVRVEEVIKNDSDAPITIGQGIVTERLGGRIRFSNGISTYIVGGQRMPEIGKKYVFFLGYNDREMGPRSRQEMSRHVLTAYELSEGNVYPLDHAGGRDFEEHAGKTATTFLAEINRALAERPIEN